MFGLGVTHGRICPAHPVVEGWEVKIAEVEEEEGNAQAKTLQDKPDSSLVISYPSYFKINLSMRHS